MIYRQNWKRCGNARVFRMYDITVHLPYATESIIKTMVGAARFELATLCSQNSALISSLQSVNGPFLETEPKTKRKQAKNEQALWKPWQSLGEHQMIDSIRVYSFARPFRRLLGIMPAPSQHSAYLWESLG